MRRAAIKFAVAAAVAGLVMAGNAAFAQMGSPAGPMGGPAAGPAAGVGGMISQIGQGVTSNIGMVSLPTEQLSAAPQLDLKKMIDQAVSTMPQQQRDQVASSMVSQNMSMLSSGNSVPAQARIAVRDQIIQDRFAAISQAAPMNFRGSIQPMMVQTMITNIRPWEFPTRFKGMMMPAMVGQISGQIKSQQIMPFMLDGITTNSFPAVPGVPTGMASGK